MILVAFWHGLRATEVCGFTRDAVQDGYLTINRLKGSLRTVQALPEHPEPLLNLRGPLIDYVGKSNGNEPVFNVSRVQFFRIFRRHAEAAGIPAHKRHPHVLKHTIAALSIHSAGVENVRQRLGHKSMSSTGEYLKVSDEDASKAVTDAIKVL